jgi:hypothetical protein
MRLVDKAAKIVDTIKEEPMVFPAWFLGRRVE